MKIEFFHDTICSFCFPMSYRMRKISRKYNDIEIIHRSFALGWESKDFINNFGSREAVKDIVINHWYKANENDDEHRFNIDGMKNTKFNFPISKPALLANKACGILYGEDKYWDLFDILQHKLFVENKSIEDDFIIEESVKELNLDYNLWKKQYLDKNTEKEVIKDIELGKQYGVHSVPTIVINEKYMISGAISQFELENTINTIRNTL